MEKIPKLCMYCNDYCFRRADRPRYDGAAIVASCPRGKVNDRACNVMARAIWASDVRRSGLSPDSIPDSQFMDKDC